MKILHVLRAPAGGLLRHVVDLAAGQIDRGHSVGIIAGMTSKTGVVGFIGGMDIGLIHRFEGGYEQGAKSVNPNIQIIQNYVGVTDAAWNNPGKGKEIAMAQISKGADVIFTAAGNSGLGAFDAVEQAGRDGSGRATRFVIGVDEVGRGHESSRHGSRAQRKTAHGRRKAAQYRREFG